MNNFLFWLQGEMTTPTLFGWFHILCLILLIGLCVVIYIFRKKISRKCVNLILLLIAMILLEVYKQIVFSFNYVVGSGGISSYWDFQWYAFPFQFCSTPMYIMLLAGALRKGKVYNCLISYLATFSLFAGLLVMLYPGNVFISMIGINIQTMICHGGMFAIGFLLLATKSVKLNFSTLLKAALVFIVMVVLALIMNTIWHYCGNGEDFNMFYIGPFIECSLPLLDIIYKSTHYLVFLIIYILGFTLASGLMLLFAKLFSLLENMIYKKNHKDVGEKIISIIKSDL